jgi:PleD family two-component response regulator
MNLDNIAIIALTAQDDEEIKSRALSVGMEDYSIVITSH